ncbi:hypothetical protein P43SY_000818 [Pythium insidiosum]|uniref:DUF659 domain-containing protein n=1 Tax=Pythium insidiosum TaxID=114742 RepID=A0AAD5LEL9_PYTIN|nr:hypothetical protein P43SY_000818 [Pythium insidiosum]
MENEVIAPPSLNANDSTPAPAPAPSAGDQRGIHGDMMQAALDAAATTAALSDSASSKSNASALSKRRRGHRSQSEIWKLLTTEENPHKVTTSTCMHCDNVVPHHHKSEKARAHLQRCPEFRRKMAQVDPNQRPPWLDLDSDGKRRRRGSTSSSSAGAVAPGSEVGGSFGSLLGMVPNGGGHAHENPSLGVIPTPLGIGRGHALPDASAVIHALTMYLYTNGAPAAHIEDPFIRQLLQLCVHPTFRPTSSDFRGPLLERAMGGVHAKMQHLLDASEVCGVAVNSWLRQPITPSERQSLHVVAANKDTLVFYLQSRQETSSDASASSERQLHNVIRSMDLCGKLIAGAVTDNTPASQVMWGKAKKIYPGRFFFGCASHGLHLFVQGVFEPEKIPADVAQSNLTTEYPFESLQAVVRNWNTVLTFMTTHASASERSRFSKEVGTSDLESLFSTPRTLCASLEALKAALPGLSLLVAEPSFLGSSDDDNRRRRLAVQAIVLDGTLPDTLRKAISILHPLDALMARLDNDSHVPCSEVFYWFAKSIPDALAKIAGLSPREMSYLLQLNQTRFNGMYGDAHGIAFLLDPRYVGEGLSPEVRKSVEDMVFEVPPDEMSTKATDEHKFAIAQELTEYVIDATREKNLNTFRYSMLVRNKKSIYQYWLTDGQRWPLLHRLAMRVFGLPASTVPAISRVLGAKTALPAGESDADVLDRLRFVQVNSKVISTAESRAASVGVAASDVLEAAL